MNMYKKIILGGMILAGSYTANAQQAFSSTPSAVGSGIAAVLGDFDNDGKIDKMSVSKLPYDSKGEIYLISDVFGSAKKPRVVGRISMDVNTGVAMDAIDFDGDGDLDFIVGARPYPRGKTVSWYRFENRPSKNFPGKLDYVTF